MDCVVVMGVSGSGKSTLGRALAAALHRPFAEGDDLHPAGNVAKMRAGVPLGDDDRQPWLAAVGEWMDQRRADGEDAVVTCSALRRTYRDVLRDGRPWVRFCLLVAPEHVLASRMSGRTGHFMPSSLLASQLATLEPLQPDEPGVVVDATGTPEQVLTEALAALR